MPNSIVNGQTVGDFIEVRNWFNKYVESPQSFCVLSCISGILTMRAGLDKFPEYNIMASMNFIRADEANQEEIEKSINPLKPSLIPETDFKFILNMLRRTTTSINIPNTSDPVLIFIRGESHLMRSMEFHKRDIYTLSTNIFACDAEAFDSISRIPATPQNLGIGTTLNV